MSDSETRNVGVHDVLAAIDLGSNSFHLVIARCLGDAVEFIERRRESVQLAAGVHADGTLSPAYRDAALAALAGFSQCVQVARPNRVRAVATHAVRSLRDGGSFLRAAERTLGHRIEIISGIKEAELIWRGVAQAQPDQTTRRLLVDIGGGSTEVIIGRGARPSLLHSAPVGCVGTSIRHFPGGDIDSGRWHAAQQDVAATLAPIAEAVREQAWQQACATSGTAWAIAGVGQVMGLGGDITASGLDTLREHLLRCKHVDRIDLPGLRADRRGIIAGGVVVMRAAFAVFGIRTLSAYPQSLRDGLLWEMHDGGLNSIGQT